MSQLTESFRTYLRPASTTEREIGQYASEEGVDWVLSRLVASGYYHQGQVCYVFCGGKQPKSVYAQLAQQSGIYVTYCESILPRGLRFIPSYRGLVRIDDPSALGGVVRKLMEQSMVVTLIFDKSLEEGFVASVRCITSCTPSIMAYRPNSPRPGSYRPG
jgi:hypothetical protein